jgi:hypothetical protein
VNNSQLGSRACVCGGAAARLRVAHGQTRRRRRRPAGLPTARPPSFAAPAPLATHQRPHRALARQRRARVRQMKGQADQLVNNTMDWGVNNVMRAHARACKNEERGRQTGRVPRRAAAAGGGRARKRPRRTTPKKARWEGKERLAAVRGAARCLLALREF